jgi:hypothetical protein
LLIGAYGAPWRQIPRYVIGRTDLGIVGQNPTLTARLQLDDFLVICIAIRIDTHQAILSDEIL